MTRCAFCKRDPFHYVDNGCGMEAVAVNCCDLGCMLWSNNEQDSAFAQQVLDNMRHHSPRKKAKAMAVLREFGLRKPSHAERRAEKTS